MAANLGNVQSTNSITSSFKAFNSLNSLFSRINGVFGLCVVYLTTSVSYCLYNVYKAYQLRGHASFGLDDDFKLIKCQALLDEAQEKKSEGGQLLLQTCESLLLSITDTMLHDKERLLLELAQCYVEQDPDHSYQIAQRLSLSYNLFDIAQAIQTKRLDFDSAKLDALFTRAFKAKGEEEKQAPSSSSKQASHLLKFAQAFLLVKNNELASRCASNAFDLAKSFENNLDQLRVFSEVAQICQKIGNSGLMEGCRNSVQAFNWGLVDTNLDKLIKACLRRLWEIPI